MVWAFYAVVAQAVLSVLGALSNYGAQDYIREQLIKSNAKAKKPKNPYGDSQVNHDLHSYLTAGLIQGIVLAVLLVMLAFNARKGKGWARWAVLIVSVLLARAPLQIIQAFGSNPALLKVTFGLTGVASIVAIVLFFVPESSRYFASLRPAGASRGMFSNGRNQPPAQTGAGATPPAPMGLRALFAPRPPAAKTQPAKADLTKSNGTKSNLNQPAARTKAKARVNPDGPIDTPAPVRAPGAAKNRGKAKGR